MKDKDLFELHRARFLLAEYLREYPEHDQADLRIYLAYEALGNALRGVPPKRRDSHIQIESTDPNIDPPSDPSIDPPTDSPTHTRIETVRLIDKEK